MKNSKIITYILALLLILSLGYIIYDKFIKNGHDVYEKSVICFYNREKKDCKLNDLSIDLHLKVEQEGTHYFYPDYLVYKDNGWKVYDIKNNISKQIDEDIKESYGIQYLHNGFIASTTEGTLFYYNAVKGKKEYTEYNSVNEVDYNHISAIKDGKINLINLEDNKIIVSREIDNNYLTFKIENGVVASYDPEGGKVILYDYFDNGKKIYELKDNETYEVYGDGIGIKIYTLKEDISLLK